ncbi:hypothetical protein AMK15_27715 [Streptomyces sp. MJM1172]|nr:hypothetical protein AMK15_27715 [Streptomyces sp. MJM1172]
MRTLGAGAPIAVGSTWFREPAAELQREVAYPRAHLALGASQVRTEIELGRFCTTAPRQRR